MKAQKQKSIDLIDIIESPETEEYRPVRYY